MAIGNHFYFLKGTTTSIFWLTHRGRYPISGASKCRSQTMFLEKSFNNALIWLSSSTTFPMKVVSFHISIFPLTASDLIWMVEIDWVFDKHPPAPDFLFIPSPSFFLFSFHICPPSGPRPRGSRPSIGSNPGDLQSPHLTSLVLTCVASLSSRTQTNPCQVAPLSSRYVVSKQLKLLLFRNFMLTCTY